MIFEYGLVMSIKFLRTFMYLAVFCTAGCGGGGGGGGGSSSSGSSSGSGASAPPVSTAPTAPTFTVGGTVSGLVASQNLVVKLGEQTLQIEGEGAFIFPEGLETGDSFEVVIEAEPPRYDCEVLNPSGAVEAQAIADIAIDCSTNASVDLFALDRLHKIQLTLTLEEWRALELDSIRANYSVRDARGRASSLSSLSHSEVYRQADFAYLRPDGSVIAEMEKVGFKMQGNTSRQYPVDRETVPNKPRRFNFSIKFDEEFDEDESVYACIDVNGNPAAVEGYPCLNIIGQNIPEFPDAEGREFNDVEKLRFRYNRDDPSYQREVLAHEVLNAAGVPAARAVHAQVDLVITGSPDQTLFDTALPQTFNLGIFVMMEQIDKPFLKLYYDKNGYLFKVKAPGILSEPDAIDSQCMPYETADEYFDESFCVVGVEKSDPESRLEWVGEANHFDPDFVNSNINGDGEFGNLSQFVPYRPTYDLKTKKKSLDEARAEFQNFVAFVQTRPDAEHLAQRFDVSGFIKAQAAEIVLGAVDHYVRVANNYYLYFNSLSDRWIYIPTDFDYTLIDTPGPNCSANPELDVCNQFLNVEAFTDIATTTAFDQGTGPHWAGRFFYKNYPPVLWNIVFATQQNRNLLYEEIEQLLEKHFDWNIVGPTLTTRRALIEQAILTMDASDASSLIGGASCAQAYNPEEIEGDSDSFCDPNRASIKDFINARRQTLMNEVQMSN